MCIEVVCGLMLVLYGVEVLGGVINVIIELLIGEF